MSSHRAQISLYFFPFTHMELDFRWQKSKEALSDLVQVGSLPFATELSARTKWKPPVFPFTSVTRGEEITENNQNLAVYMCFVL